MAKSSQKEWANAWRKGRYRTAYGKPCNLAAGVPKQIAAVSFVPGATGPDADDISHILLGVRIALESAGTFILLCEDSSVRDRCKAIIAAAQAPVGGAMQ
jgi:hypothetical protein